MDFQERLQRAIERGHHSKSGRAREAAAKSLSEEECRSLHTQCRLEISEHIENCLRQLDDQFPGFRVETLLGDSGWGTAILRDDVDLRRGQSRRNFYSRLEMTVRPFSKYHVLDLGTKGTVRNKEIFTRSHYEELNKVDLESFKNLIDLWVLEYAEKYASSD